MRIQHRYLTFEKNEDLVHQLDKLGAKYTVTEKSFDATTHFYSLEFLLYEDDPRFSEIKDSLSKFNLLAQITSVFEKSDHENAQWFVVNAGNYQYPQPESNFGYLNTTFQLDNYCSLCAIGKVQNAAYRLKTEPKQHNNQFWGLHWEYEAIFVRQETKNILQREKVKGLNFSKPVLHKNNSDIQSLYQLHLDTILEPGFDNYNTKIITCKVNNEEDLNNDPISNCCGRVKFHHPMIGGYLFDKAIFNPEFDFVKSNEYFGSGGSANRLKIVSRKLKILIEKNKLKGLSFQPIIHQKPKQ